MINMDTETHPEDSEYVNSSVDLGYVNPSMDYVPMGPNYERLGKNRSSIPEDHIYESSTQEKEMITDPERSGPKDNKHTAADHIKCEKRHKIYKAAVIGMAILCILLIAGILLAYFLPNLKQSGVVVAKTANMTDDEASTPTITTSSQVSETQPITSAATTVTISTSTSTQDLGAGIEECVDGWTQNGRSCYILGDQYEKWDQAKESCVSGDYGVKSHLLEINNLQEYDYINKTLLSQYGYPHTQLWLGARWQDDEWVWEDSREVVPSTWPQWGYRGPRSTQVGDCLCISTSHLYTGQLFDYRCSDLRPYICEYDI